LRHINYSTASLLEEACRTAKDRTFIEFPSRQYSATYGEFQTQVGKVAGLLAAKGMKSGDHVAIMSENSPELLHASYAVTSMRAVWVPLNSLLIGESLRFTIDASDSAYVVASSRYRDEVQQAVDRVDRSIEILSIEELDKEAREGSAEFESSAEPNDICYLLYTSGTTGLPKGVLHTHNSVIRLGVRTEEALETTADDRVHMQLPFFHVWASLVMLGVMYFKATIVVEDGFDSERYWMNVAEYRVTQDHWTGTMPLNLLKLPPAASDQKTEMTVFGTVGAMHDVLKARWPNVRFQSVYGQSEHGAFTIVPVDQIYPGSDGIPKQPDVLLIVDDDGKPLPVGETGEIVMRCKCGVRMQGYYGNPEATAETLRGDDIYSGDLGYLDERGHVHFVGRKKNALRVRGEMVSVEHTEHLVNQHPKIAESAVTGYRPPEKEASREDEIVVHIVARKGETLTATEFHGWSEKNLAKFMRPRYLVFRESLPKSATERIQHFILKDEGIKGANRLF
jgi:crotonobetaine/carnitine-CoA ligase